MLHLPDDGSCSFEIVREHAAGAIAHLDSGSIDVRVTAPGDGLIVDVRSLDTPANPVPGPVPPDEGGLAILDGLAPGSYEVRLLRDGEVVETKTVVIEPAEADGTPGGDLVEVVLDGRPD